MIRDNAIAEILASEDDRERAADELVNAANIAGGADNITVVIVDIVEVADAGTTTEAADRADTVEVPVVDARTVDAAPSASPKGPEDTEGDADLEALRAAVKDGEPPRRHWWQRRPRS